MELYTYKARVIRVLDGDTIEAELKFGFNVSSIRKVRLLSYDANETKNVKYKENNKELGLEQKKWLEDELAKSSFIYVRSIEADAFGRCLGEVFNDREESINNKFIAKWPESEVK